LELVRRTSPASLTCATTRQILVYLLNDTLLIILIFDFDWFFGRTATSAPSFARRRDSLTMFRTAGCRVPARNILRSNAGLKLPLNKPFTTNISGRLGGRPSSSPSLLRTSQSSSPRVLLNGKAGHRLGAPLPAILAPRSFSTSSHQREEIKKSRDAPVSGDKSTADTTTSKTTAADLNTRASDVVDPARAISSDIVRYLTAI